ncbi:hypothetical protein AVEN_11037-1 [Araneus ventricosus]|uniref:Uncharacterized protein n=1 Tax=Araneus ventricosus TaxID=182803 RepID=A0A4Y2TXN8_ARAVE|nr:hypothetical protein AVEN_11037-1 [Araneus ventricosus]
MTKTASPSWTPPSPRFRTTPAGRKFDPLRRFKSQTQLGSSVESRFEPGTLQLRPKPYTRPPWPRPIVRASAAEPVVVSIAVSPRSGNVESVLAYTLRPGLKHLPTVVR